MTQKELLIALGISIRMIRLANDITQTRLAITCNFEKSTMSKIEAGQVNVSYYTLHRLSEGLGVSICKLLNADNS